MTTENNRDLAADLAICEAATEYVNMCVGDNEVFTDYMEPDLPDGHHLAEFVRTKDAEFFVEAREGWPEAIRRALAAEEQVGALIELLRETIDMITPNETEYKCDYRRRYARHQIGKIVPEEAE